MALFIKFAFPLIVPLLFSMAIVAIPSAGVAAVDPIPTTLPLANLPPNAMAQSVATHPPPSSQSPSPIFPFSPSHDQHFHLYPDYADFEDLLTLVEENVRRMNVPSMKRWKWSGGGESRGKKARPLRNGPKANRQFGVPIVDSEARKRRSEGRFPVGGVFASSSSPLPSAALHSGRIFPSPRIYQRFRPLELAAPEPIRVEASSLHAEYPEWLALHAGDKRGPIRARSYRELLLHALNRAQAELSRRHRLYSAGEGPKEDGAWAKQKKQGKANKKAAFLDGESRKKKKQQKQKQVKEHRKEVEGGGGGGSDEQKCRECFGHWRVRRAAGGTKEKTGKDLAKRCCHRKEQKVRAKKGKEVEKEEEGRKKKKGRGGKEKPKAKIWISTTTTTSTTILPSSSKTMMRTSTTTNGNRSQHSSHNNVNVNGGSGKKLANN